MCTARYQQFLPGGPRGFFGTLLESFIMLSYELPGTLREAVVKRAFHELFEKPLRIHRGAAVEIRRLAPPERMYGVTLKDS